MNTTEFKTIILRADDGFMLTDVAEVDIIDRTLATTVALGAADSPDNYREITLAEAEQIRALQQKALDELAGESVEGRG